MTDVLISAPETPEEEKHLSASDGGESGTESEQDDRPEDRRSDGGDGALADDEYEEEEGNDDDDDDDDDGREQQDSWTPQEAARAFTANVSVVKQEEIQMVEAPVSVKNSRTNPPQITHPAWIQELDKPEDTHCVEVMRLCVCVTAAALIFPLLTWGGYKLLPFTAPPLENPALRVVYTLRCAFFATIPIALGVVVQGVSRLRFRTLSPLFKGTWQIREVAVHSHYVRDSLHLYLLYFLQLAVMATYAQQEMLKLVPLLTVIFVFGRLIYWISAVFSSSVRALGFALSFLPLPVLVGANLYFIGSAGGREAVFDVAPPTTAPPPKRRWFG